jgi:protein-L-isoaspartate(D-aspartate) O-methyltransferase
MRLVAAALLIGGCVDPTPRPSGGGPDWDAERRRMVSEQLAARDVSDARVLSAMGSVPRHEFVPPEYRRAAYADQPLPIGGGQTISQPYVVALMTQLLQLRGGERVLEVGTGSGYQAAILAQLAKEVYSIEIDPELAKTAQETLARLGCDNVRVRAGDGFFGWPEAAPFDAIIVTAAAPRLPEKLVAQLREGGRIVLPVGSAGEQDLKVGIKREGRVELRSHGGVLFVPMTGEIRKE